MKKNIALLCDYGLDDAIATLYLFKYAHLFDRIDIIPVAGNFPLEQTFINAKRILSYAETLPENIRIIDTSDVEQPCESIPEIHGNDGIGDVLPSEYKEIVPTINYEKWLDCIDGNHVIVSLGPCSVTADILKKKGALPLVIMAGNISEPPNYNGYEFNHGVNKNAFSECTKYSHVAATLDTCHNEKCDLNLTSVNEKGLLEKMLCRYIELSHERNEAICSVYDMIAVDYLIHPERFTVEEKTDKDGNYISVLKYISPNNII